MASPRRRSSRAVSASVSAPAAHNAEYSPSEWPATKAASRATSSPASALERPQRRQAGRHQRRLGVGGQRQLRLRPLEDQFRQLSPSAASTSLEHPRRRRKRRGERLAHADGLRALTGKHEGGLQLRLLRRTWKAGRPSHTRAALVSRRHRSLLNANAVAQSARTGNTLTKGPSGSAQSAGASAVPPTR